MQAVSLATFNLFEIGMQGGNAPLRILHGSHWNCYLSCDMAYGERSFPTISSEFSRLSHVVIKCTSVFWGSLWTGKLPFWGQSNGASEASQARAEQGTGAGGGPRLALLADFFSYLYFALFPTFDPIPHVGAWSQSNVEGVMWYSETPWCCTSILSWN